MVKFFLCLFRRLLVCVVRACPPTFGVVFVTGQIVNDVCAKPLVRLIGLLVVLTLLADL